MEALIAAVIAQAILDLTRAGDDPLRALDALDWLVLGDFDLFCYVLGREAEGAQFVLSGQARSAAEAVERRLHAAL